METGKSVHTKRIQTATKKKKKKEKMPAQMRYSPIGLAKI